MPVYEPEKAELGKNAINRRVGALRAMNGASGPRFTRYERGSDTPPSYLVETLSGVKRNLHTREVPSYVAGMADGYPGFRAQVQEALDEALEDPTVSDREDLMRVVLAKLDTRIGAHLEAAICHFDVAPADPDQQVAAVA